MTSDTDAGGVGSSGQGARRVVRNRVFLLFDLVGWSATPFVALAIRLDGSYSVSHYLTHLAAFGVAAMACKLFALWVCGLYRRYWRYASIDELALIWLAVAGAGIASAVVYDFII